MMTTTSCRLPLAITLSVLLLPACGPGEDAPADATVAASLAAADTAAAAPPSAPAVAVDPADIAWLEGTWRGTMPDGTPFYERYTLVDDSTYAIHAFADSTLADPRDIGQVAVRGGVVHRVEASGARVAAMPGDDGALLFGTTARGFTWAPRPDGAWTATIHSARGPSPEGDVVYVMEPFAPGR